MERDKVIGDHYAESYTKLVKRTARRVPHNSYALAEEVVQEAYRRALDYFETYDPHLKNFDTWFNAILRNATNDCKAIEGDNGVTKELDENTEDIRASKDEFKSMPFMLSSIYKMAAHNKRNYNVLSLFYINGLTSKEISEYLGVSHSNVRQIVYKFKNSVNGDSN